MFKLYTLKNCPYCNKVKEYMETNGINVEIVDIEQNGNKSELISLGGKEQVPYLYNTQTRTGLYESSDIIEYLKQGI